MKKRMSFIVIGILLAIMLNCPIFAEENQTDLPNSEEEIKAYTEELIESSGANEMYDQLPEDAKEMIEDLNLSDLDFTSILNLKPSDFLQLLLKQIKNSLREPLVTISKVLAIVIICALLESFKLSLWEGSISTVFHLVSTLSIVTIVAMPILACIKDVAASLNNCSLFITSFMPIFSGVVIASGQPLTASAYNIFLISLCQAISAIATSTLIPVMGVYLSFSMIGSVSNSINIEAAAASIKKIVGWVLGLLTTILVGFLTVQSIVSSNADGVSVKATKFLISSFIPVVGSALSEAFVAAQGYLKLLKATVGVFGVIGSAAIFVPIFIKLIIWYLTATVCSALGSMLNIERVSKIMQSVSYTFGVLIAITACFALLVIVSTTVVLMMGFGT